MKQIIKAPLLRGFFAWWCAAAICSAGEVDSRHTKNQAGGHKFIVKIEADKIWHTEFRSPGIDTIDVSLNSFGKEIGGFDLKIGTDDPYFHIDSILPGELVDSCKWELFHPRIVAQKPILGPAQNIWQVIALSRTIPDSSKEPSCFGFDRKVSLIKLVISWGSQDPHKNLEWLLSQKSLALFFYWEDCSDNTISSKIGDNLFVSDKVFDLDSEISEKRPRFPSRTGQPPNCFNPSKSNAPQRLVDFYSARLYPGVPHPPPPIHLHMHDSNQAGRDSTISPK